MKNSAPKKRDRQQSEDSRRTPGVQNLYRLRQAVLNSGWISVSSTHRPIPWAGTSPGFGQPFHHGVSYPGVKDAFAFALRTGQVSIGHHLHFRGDQELVFD